MKLKSYVDADGNKIQAFQFLPEFAGKPSREVPADVVLPDGFERREVPADATGEVMTVAFLLTTKDPDGHPHTEDALADVAPGTWVLMSDPPSLVHPVVFEQAYKEA